MPDLYFYRDPEAEETKEAVEEAKVPGAEEVAADSGFVTATAGDWEAAGGFTGAPVAGGSWDADPQQWDAATGAAAAGNDWATDAQPEAAATSGW